jgi:hypothetical protein
LTVVRLIVSDAGMVRGWTILLLLALLMSPSLAAAQAMRVNAAQNMTYGDAAALLAKSCGAEIEANCRGVNLDATRLRECLSRNTDVLSRNRQAVQRLDQGDQQIGAVPDHRQRRQPKLHPGHG